ncbi:MAG: O-antigen ligase family protein [Gemmatimonadota bacterium]
MPAVAPYARQEAGLLRASSAIPRVDLLQVSLSLVLLVGAWRIQDLYGILAALQLPILASFGVYLLSALDRDYRRTLRLSYHRLLGFLVAILVLASISAPFALYPGLSFKFLLNDLIRNVVLAFLITVSIRGFVDLERMAKIHLIGAVILCVDTILHGSVTVTGRLDRDGYYDSNDLAMLAVCALPLALYFLRRQVPAKVRLAALGTAGLLLLFIVKTGSRGGFLGLIATVAFMLLAFRAFSKKARFGSIGVIVVGMLLFGSDQYWKMMNSIIHPQNDYNVNTEDGRIHIWKRGIGYMKARPLLGVGPRNFLIAEGTISPLAWLQQYGHGIRWAAPHNSFVEIGAELGVTGLVLFVSMLIAVFVTLYRAARGPPGGPRPPPEQRALAQALAATFVGFCVSGFFITQAFSFFLYTMIAMVAGLAKVQRMATPAGRPAALRPRRTHHRMRPVG